MRNGTQTRVKAKTGEFSFLKSALSNIISETRDELDPTKCTGGGIMGLRMFVAVSCNHRVSDSQVKKPSPASGSIWVHS